MPGVLLLLSYSIVPMQNKRDALKSLAIYVPSLQLLWSCLPPISIAVSKVNRLSCPRTDLSTKASDSLICTAPLPNVPSIISASPYCQKHLLVFLLPRRGLVFSLNKSLLEPANDTSAKETVFGGVGEHGLNIARGA